jgi:hypothetical protein
VVCPDQPEGQLAQDGPGGAVDNDDVIGCGFDDGDTLALPVRAGPVKPSAASRIGVVVAVLL